MLFTKEEWNHIKDAIDFELITLTMLSSIRDLNEKEIKEFELANQIKEKMEAYEDEKKNNMDIRGNGSSL